MIFGNRKPGETEVQAMPTIAMAIMEQCGIRELIDSLTQPDPQRILTPGHAVKALVGGFFMGMGRRPLYKIDRDYANAPVELLFGEGVKAENLNARAFSRALDDLYGLDLPELAFEIHSMLCRRYGLMGFLYHMDSTNFGVSAIKVERDEPDAAIPEWNGHAKDGDNSRRVYNLQTVTDSDGIVCYEKPYDGSTSDERMNENTMRYLAGRLNPGESTIIADSKIVSGPLIRLMTELGFGFISKCPLNFAERIHDDIVYSVLNSRMDPSSYKDGWEVYDCSETVDGIRLRFVAYRTPKGSERDIDYLRKQGLADVKRRFGKFSKREFNCAEDARREFEEAMSGHVRSAYVVTGDVVAFDIPEKYGRRGRPPQGWTPRMITQYRVDVRWEFSEGLAEELSADRQVRVLVTNLPLSTTTRENPRDGVAAGDVLRMYMGQYLVERVFRTSKSEFQMDSVCLHTPSRENAFMFVVSLATMIAGLVTTVVRRRGILRTAEGMIDDLARLDVVYDEECDEGFLRGSAVAHEEFMTYTDILGIRREDIFSHDGA